MLKGCQLLDNIEDIIAKYSPYIYFCKNEQCFPIDINKYLNACDVRSRSNDKIINNPTCDMLYQFYQNKTNDLYLEFKDKNWKEDLKGDYANAKCYVRVIANRYGFALVYFYLFSHTEAYRAFNCCCKLNKYSHKADLKFIVVFIKYNRPFKSYNISKVYYGAHGTHAGVWKKIGKIQLDKTHPIAYSCCGDHSFYPYSGIYPRIFFAVYDKCKRGFLCKPEVVRICDDKDDEFKTDTMGWVYFPGEMSEDGISSPSNQWFWNAELPIKSNNWFKRLFCSMYF